MRHLGPCPVCREKELAIQREFSLHILTCAEAVLCLDKELTTLSLALVTENGVRRPRQIRGPKIRANVPPKGPCRRHRVCHLGAIVVAWAARGRLGVGRM